MNDRAVFLRCSLKVDLMTSGPMGSGSLRVSTAWFLKPKGAGRLGHRNGRSRRLGVRSDRRERALRDRVHPQLRSIVEKNVLIESGEVVLFCCILSPAGLDWTARRTQTVELLAWARKKIIIIIEEIVLMELIECHFRCQRRKRFEYQCQKCYGIEKRNGSVVTRIICKCQ